MFHRRVAQMLLRLNYSNITLISHSIFTKAPSCQSIKNIYLVDESDIGTKNHSLGCNKFTTRTHTCGELSVENIGETVTLCGWLEFQRMNKFLTLRDGYGNTQLLISEQDTKTRNLINKLAFESILEIQGTVLSRPKNMINEQQVTGKIEVLVNSLKVLNAAHSNLPFNVREFQKAKESLRMQYRYIDLRFAEMQRNLRIRSQLLTAMRNFLVNECNFVDVETPTLFKATPGGAQEFIVPTRFPGQFYSLVQSPQQFKQMLMAGAIDRYFQIARCYRDEGARPDRQPEFTQLDIELSFTTINGVISLIEELFQSSWPQFLPSLPSFFPRIKYQDAMEKYGTDKPDTRADFQLQNCSSILKNYDSAYALVFEESYISALTKSVKENLQKLAKLKSADNMKFVMGRFTDCSDWVTKMSRLLGETEAQNLAATLNITWPSVIFLAFGDAKFVLPLLGQVRVEYINTLEQQGQKIRKEGMYPLWITDFPLFERDDVSGSLQTVHHPFTAPHMEDLASLESDPLKVRSQAYDLVLNGNEIGGGSIRIHDPILQRAILKMLQIEPSGLQHMLDMLGSGCPPHGGIALGLDRLLATILQTPTIRDVIAFPKTFEGRDPLSGAPSVITDKDKKLYHIKVCSGDV